MLPELECALFHNKYCVHAAKLMAKGEAGRVPELLHDRRF